MNLLGRLGFAALAVVVYTMVGLSEAAHIILEGP